MPRPLRNFVLWNKNPSYVCGRLENFPQVCTILLKEGEPLDYVADRGYCSVLGIMREAEPKTVSNICRVKNNHIRQFTLQFLSNSLTLFTLPEQKADGTANNSAWLALVVVCKPYLF